MKKLIPFLLIAFLSIFIVSCNSDDNNYIDNDTIAEVYEIKNENFTRENDYYYSLSKSFNRPLYSGDMVLIFKQDGILNGNPIWVPLPKSYYLSEGYLEYTYDFTINDIKIYADADFNLVNTSYISGQTFRVLVVPAIQGRTTNTTVDLKDYNSVIKYYNINDKNIKKL